MRVALVDPSLFTLPYDRALARGLQQAGHQVVLLGRRPHRDDGDASGVELAPHFYPVAESALARRLPTALRLGVKGLDHAASMLRLRAALRRRRPDVVHFQWMALPLVDRRLLGGLRRLAPLVLTVHDTDPFNGDPSASLQGRGFVAGLGAFDRLIVHTDQGRARLVAAGLPPERLAVLPHGLLFDAPPRPEAPDPMQGELTFLLFGKMKPYKGLDVLIEAFARLPPELRAGARVRIVGKPYMDLAPVRDLAERLGVADRVGIEPRFVDDADIPGLFGPGVVAVFPYREIEASGVLTIALAHGRPVVASAIGNFAETVEDGVQGLLAPRDDVPALSSALAALLADRPFAARCAAAARHLVDRLPGWAEIGRRTAQVYSAAGAGAPSASQSA